MTPERLVSYLSDCKQRIADCRRSSDFLPIHCAIASVEGPGASFLCSDFFKQRLTPLAHISNWTISAQAGGLMEIGFFVRPRVKGDMELIQTRVDSLSRILGELDGLVRELPAPIVEKLALPVQANWWRKLFHLAWHFDRPFLHCSRTRMLQSSRSEKVVAPIPELLIQMAGLRGQTDVLPGKIFSELPYDVYTCSEVAIDLIVGELQTPWKQPEFARSTPVWSATTETRVAFRELRVKFEEWGSLPRPNEFDCKLLKFASTFTTPPATEWAGMRIGGCVDQLHLLSMHNEHAEYCQLRGPAVNAFCTLATRAGELLPTDAFPDRPVLFDRRYDGTNHVEYFQLSNPAMDRRPVGRWLGFVFNTLKIHNHQNLTICWETPEGPGGHGQAILHCNLFQASIIAIDLAGFLSTSPAPQSNPESGPPSPLLEVEHWSDLAIALDASNQIWAATPPPLCGAVIAKKDFKKLPLKGKRWKVLLGHAASKDGRSVRKSDFMTDMGYQIRRQHTGRHDGHYPHRDDPFQADVLECGLKQTAKLNKRMRDAISDLRRELRTLVKGPDEKNSPSMLMCDDAIIDTGFVVRAFVNDDHQRLRFGVATAG